MLFLGMDCGVIMFLVFSTPLKGLFETPFKKTSGSHQVYLQVRIYSGFNVGDSKFLTLWSTIS